MAPNEDLEEIVESFGVVERHLNVEECVVAVRCAALFADVIAKGFDLSFSLVGKSSTLILQFLKNNYSLNYIPYHSFHLICLPY